MVPKGWTLLQVSDICKLQNGNSFKPHEWDTQGLPIIRIQNLNGSDNYNYFSGVPQDKWLVEPGQLLFSWAGTKGVSFGPFIWNGPKGVLNQHIYKVFANENVHGHWLYLALLHITQKIEAQAHGFKSTLLHVQKKDIDNQFVLTPPVAEQKKMAQILSTWDKAISVTEKLLTNSQQQKKALMQQLLTGKKRLGLPAGSYEFKITRYGSIPKDWDYPAIKEICTQVSEKNSAAVDHPVLSCSKYDGFVDSLKYFNKKVYSDDLSGYRLIHRGCFGFPSNHIEEGSIGLQNLYDTGIVSPIYVVFRASPTKVDNSYLYAVLKTDHYKQIFGAATNASVDRRGSLRWKEFNQIHVPLPPLKEQQKISAVLSAADAEITTLEKKLACLKDEKKALMQQLLTGKRRVKVDEAVAE
ncbi:restriction endonuclease subunit S [Escherichia coli]|nr:MULTISPECIES: restriction endonuclease subunit S [Enterobacteriaceae]EFO2120983.1 restriction endonuclease subunit S [Escherichia coli O3]MBJ3557198.1 restriction endonuclease subunit S [Salmonella enterica subsp. enterica serovar Derby]HBQ3758254.1 restriction endonuclease subunit S [Klebsiella quasipneumoniae subsp. similipneumoniae]HDK6628499.1 restriction endonuclease subunit S [Klebsiella pneumoniae]EEU9139777.1 restriction endonuclease subunit S [Escherichia coli]